MSTCPKCGEFQRTTCVCTDIESCDKVYPYSDTCASDKESKRLALEAAVRELLERLNKKSHDGFIYYEVPFNEVDNLRKAYRELSE